MLCCGQKHTSDSGMTSLWEGFVEIKVCVYQGYGFKFRLSDLSKASMVL